MGGSRGPADLLALRRGEVLLVECKTDEYLNPKRRERLRILAENLGARAILAHRKKGNLTLEEL